MVCKVLVRLEVEEEVLSSQLQALVAEVRRDLQRESNRPRPDVVAGLQLVVLLGEMEQLARQLIGAGRQDGGAVQLAVDG